MSDLSLQGVRVLDLTRLVPGPYASLALADLGAEVIKVEEPKRGDPLRYLLSPHTDGKNVLFDLLNRNKKSITLNLKSSEGKAILLALARDADVLLEGFRPGVMKRLGLDYEVLCAVNQSLIYASISGYGQTGPYHLRAGHDLNYIALGGLLAVTGRHGGPPVIPGVPIADLVGGLWTAFGVVAALWKRERTGRGRYLDVSMLDGVLALLAVPLAEWWARGCVPEHGAMPLNGGWACYNIYETADGQYMSLAALEPKFWRAFCMAVGREDWIGRQNDVNQASLISEVAALFRTQSQADWVSLFAEYDCCCEPVLAVDQVSSHPQVQHSGLLSGRQLATPLASRNVTHMPAPELGEHTAELLTELGYSSEDIEHLRQQGIV